MKLPEQEISVISYFPDLDMDEAMPFPSHSILRVSVFDHWLSEEEAEGNPLMSYSIALEAGRKMDYQEGENRFLQIYKKFSENGVICNRPGPTRVISSAEERDQILFNSLREKYLMDIYFPSHEIRVLGGYDRTDTIIVNNPAYLPEIRDKVHMAGLYILLD